eukprot:CAMPEP_0195052690 /NCGR_PEP_ID=MMETSP0448-20130528/1997_1 /TAXON_ID=66468 /ORGANISM="Heterocapsa triquestra, Strain CCMP 448" /LENGTH=47 /DNA_ID= /DNA_START= /DNA_END= /DNA_ORIENTATION=
MSEGPGQQGRGAASPQLGPRRAGGRTDLDAPPTRPGREERSYSLASF